MFDPLELLLEMEAEMIDNMTALLSRGAVASAEWQAAKLAEVGALRAMNTATAEKYISEIQANLYEYYKTLGTDKVLESGIPGLSDVLPEGTAANLAAVWKVWETQTMNQLKNLGMTLIDESQTTFIRIVYKSTAKMLAGSTTLREAIAETSRGWIAEAAAQELENGIPALKDKAGRMWSVEGYAQVVLRSNEAQMTWATQNAAYDMYDVDLVEITSHLGARPNCFPYQGKVYSRSGQNPGYPALSSTSLGQPDGIMGCNCGHDIWPFDPEVGQTYQTYSEEENTAAYKESQKQRYLERQIRQAKRKASAAGIDPESDAAKRANKLVKDRQAKMREFIDDTGRTRRRDREQIY